MTDKEDEFEFLNELPLPDAIKDEIKKSWQPTSPIPEQPALELCQDVANDLGVAPDLVREILRNAISRIARPLTDAKRIRISDFGSINVNRGIKRLRNPGTGEIVGHLNCELTIDPEVADLFPHDDLPPPQPSDVCLPVHKVTISPADANSNTSRSDQKSAIGGQPNFIQESQSICVCQPCNKEMTFIGQLDSMDLDGLDDDPPTDLSDLSSLTQFKPPLFGDAGVMYFYFCFDCGQGKCELVTY